VTANARVVCTDTCRRECAFWGDGNGGGKRDPIRKNWITRAHFVCGDFRSTEYRIDIIKMDANILV
jgi:hypothetical protein